MEFIASSPPGWVSLGGRREEGRLTEGAGVWGGES
jgi:hypothetical protein